MFSRAHILIENDLNDLINNPVNGILVFKLFEDNFFDIVAKIEGLPNTIWESGIFQVYLKFNEFYNDAPPLVSFQTIPFHPNIDVSTGRPSLDFLDDFSKWKNEYNIKFILQSLQHLLSNPLLDRAVNMDAVFMLKGNPERYVKIAHESVIASQRIQKGLAPFLSLGQSKKNTFLKNNETYSTNTMISNIVAANNNSSSAPQTPLYSTNTISASATLPLTTLEGAKSLSFVNSSVSNNRSKKRISFEDYHRLWKGIATSKSDEASENVYIKYDLHQNPMQMAQHLGLTIKDLEMQMMQQLNDHKNIMYGKFNFKQNDDDENNNDNNNDNLKRINKMKNVYLNKNNDSKNILENNYNNNNNENNLLIKSSAHSSKSRSIVNNNNNNWENEVDELVNWTQNLNEQVI